MHNGVVNRIDNAALLEGVVFSKPDSPSSS